MASSKDIVEAVAVMVPLVTAFAKVAEQSGASGADKHAAVSEQIEIAYKNLQSTKSIKEIKDVPFDLIAPVLLPATYGILSIVVGLFNKLGVFLKEAIS